jgi:hypothetical protein
MPSVRVIEVKCHDEQDTDNLGGLFGSSDEIYVEVSIDKTEKASEVYTGLDTNDTVKPNLKVDFSDGAAGFITLYERDDSGDTYIDGTSIKYDPALDHVRQEETFKGAGGEYTVTYELWA